MHIAIVKDAVLPTKLYGGTERVVYSLGRALSRLGHEVTFLCRAGSEASFAHIQPIDPSRSIAAQIPAGVDILHFNDAVPEDIGERPYIVTINGNLGDGASAPAMAVFVSRNHAQRHGSEHYVHNGLDWDDYPQADLTLQRDSYHFLGKAAWRVKNVRGAIRIIRQVPGAQLHVLGGTRLNFKMGFRFTPSPRIHFHGMVDNDAKQHFISHSKGLVFPVLWDEPFGLCLTESLYYGAPVFGTQRGSLPEIVAPEVGFLSNDEDELARHIAEGHEYSPQRCHEYAAGLFGAEPMAKAYLDVYQSVLDGQRW